jgi:glycosyltransferase involved in cell wall biosynthesis
MVSLAPQEASRSQAYLADDPPLEAQLHHQRLRLAYDISVLAVGHKRPSARTGIFRAVAALGGSLADAEDVKVSFTANTSVRELELCLDYLRNRQELADTPIVGPPGALRAARARLRVRDALSGLSTGRRHTLLGNTLRRLMIKLAELAMLPGRPLTRESLANVDVFHSPFFPLPAYLKSSTLVRFLTVYDLIPILHPEWFRGVPVHRILKTAIDSVGAEDWVICISESTKRDLCNYAKIDPQRVLVTPLAAARDVFRTISDDEYGRAVRARYGLPKEPYVLSVNTLEPRKNIAFAIRCFAELVQQERIPDLHFVLVGARGWDYGGILHTIDKLPQVRDRITLAGYIPDADLAAVYGGALAFVYPSLYEGFGLPPLEAMQCAIPVITSNTSSLPEVVGDAGIMVDPTDRDRFCEGMLALYRDSTLRDSLAAKSVARAAQFTWERCARETVNAYRLGSNGKASR